MLWRIDTSLAKLYASQSQHDAADIEIDAARGLIDEISASVPVLWRQNYLRAALDTLPALRPPSPRRLAKKEFGPLPCSFSPYRFLTNLRALHDARTGLLC